MLSALLVGCAGAEAQWQRVSASYPAPDFTLASLDGRSVTLSAFRGRVVLVEFWATWCGPCRYSTPSMEQIAKEFRQQGVEVLLINAGEGSAAIRQWAGRRFSAATILLDQDGAVAERYGVNGIPRLLVINQDGLVQYDEGGYSGGLERNLRRILGELLATRTNATPQEV